MNCTAEQKIKQAALQVFVKKGFANCSSREIAKEAGMNVALVNYYFRSKSKLFTIIFDSVMAEFMQSMVQVFNGSLPIREKIRFLIEREYEFLTKNPEIPIFILNELSRNPEAIEGFKPVMEKVMESGVFEEVAKLQKSGEMRQMDMLNVTLLIMSNCQYPFMAKPLMSVIHHVDEVAYYGQLEAHKNHVTLMILNYLFLNDSKAIK